MTREYLEGECSPISKVCIAYMQSSSWCPLKCMSINGRRGKVSPLTWWSKKLAPHQIILSLDLIAFKFNILLIVDFFRFNPMESEGSMSVKLALVLDHGMTRISKGYNNEWWARPVKLVCTCGPLI